MTMGFIGTLVHSTVFILLTTNLVLFIVGMFLNFYVVYEWVDGRNERFRRT
jgi:hypothetical protein